MSGAVTALVAAGSTGLQAIQAAGGPLSDLLNTVLMRNQRSINPQSGSAIIPDVVVEENHSDRIMVTQHPIADGSPISDHVYKMPATVTMRLGWSNATSLVGTAVSGFLSGGGFDNISGGLSGAGSSLLSSFKEERVKDIYDKLIKLQYDKTAATPVNFFKLVTGKRTYDTMLLTEVSVRTDRTSEYSLLVEAHFQEVFIVKTQQTTQPAQANQASPSSTSSAQTTPDKSVTSSDANNSNNQTPAKQIWNGLVHLL